MYAYITHLCRCNISDLGKLFKSSDDSQLPWKIGRGIIKFAKEAKRFMVEQLGRQTLLRPL